MTEGMLEGTKKKKITTEHKPTKTKTFSIVLKSGDVS